MSGFSSHGVGAFCAKAVVVSAASAAAVKKVVRNRVISRLMVILPAETGVPVILLNKSRTSFFRQYDGSRRAHHGSGGFMICHRATMFPFSSTTRYCLKTSQG